MEGKERNALDELFKEQGLLLFNGELRGWELGWFKASARYHNGKIGMRINGLDGNIYVFIFPWNPRHSVDRLAPPDLNSMTILKLNQLGSFYLKRAGRAWSNPDVANYINSETKLSRFHIKANIEIVQKYLTEVINTIFPLIQLYPEEFVDHKATPCWMDEAKTKPGCTNITSSLCFRLPLKQSGEVDTKKFPFMDKPCVKNEDTLDVSKPERIETVPQATEIPLATQGRLVVDPESENQDQEEPSYIAEYIQARPNYDVFRGFWGGKRKNRKKFMPANILSL